MKNYYAILEVPVGGSLEEIRQAYRRLVQENLDNEAAFGDLKEAYETLTTPARRAEYDLAAWGDAPEAGPVRLGRCPMGAEAQCPVLQAHISPADKYCPECGFLLSALNAEGGFDLPAPPEAARQAWLEEPSGQTHPLRPGLNLVGRESADILLPDKTISRQHARLEVGEDSAVTVEDLGSTNGTQVNDMLLDPHVARRLAAGDRLRFGSILTALHLPPPAPARSEPGPARREVALRKEAPEPPAVDLNAVARAHVVQMHDGAAQAFPLVPGVTTFGRRAENSVVLQGDPYVSGSHAQIIADEDVFRLTDVGSTNGTLLNGVRLEINAPVTLSPGDIILIGGTALRFEPVAAVAPEAPDTVPAEPIERTAQEYDAPEAESPTEDALTEDAARAEG